MDKLVSIVSLAPETRSKNDDDFADRLSSRYSVVVIIVFAVVVSANIYIGKPITCWAPVHFTGSHTKFATNYCWVKNTYYLPWENEIPRAHEDDKRQMVIYYQWIPFILLIQAILFYVPTQVWHAFNSKGGIDADNILESAHSLSRTDKIDDKDKTLTLISNQMDRFLGSRRTQDTFQCDFKHILSATLCRPCGRRFGNYLVILFIFSKICYIGNVIGQLFLLNKLLKTSFNTYGVDIMSDMISDHDWTEQGHVTFPRVTMCDFNIRRLGNVHRYTLQCVLPLNMYTEKIYVFLWFWMVFVAAASVLSMFTWVLRCFMHSDRLKFIRNHLNLMQKIQNQRDVDWSEEFLDDYLKQDGAFLLRLIAHNTNNITTTEIICKMWDDWKERRQAVLDHDDMTLPLKENMDKGEE